MQVDALVALQPDQARAGRRRQRARHLGLADARLSLEQQRLLEHDREVDRERQRPVGQVALAGERAACPVYRLELFERHPINHANPAASSSARRQSTRAR